PPASSRYMRSGASRVFPAARTAMSVSLDRDDVTATVDRLVDDLLDRAGIAQPPVDAIALAQQHLGMVVCLDKRQAQRGRAQRAGSRAQIYLRPEPSEERHQ